MPQMHERIKNDLQLSEERLWAALTGSSNPGDRVLKLCHSEAVLLFPGSTILAKDSDPSLETVLKEGFQGWESYQMGNIRCLVLDLMAGVIVYEVLAKRGGKTFHASCSTTWQQAADGEWRIFCHQETPI